MSFQARSNLERTANDLKRLSVPGSNQLIIEEETKAVGSTSQIAGRQSKTILEAIQSGEEETKETGPFEQEAAVKQEYQEELVGQESEELGQLEPIGEDGDAAIVSQEELNSYM